jgi:endonuclease/exonuclease/phosphatase family metal-dependent hydrolase
MPRFRILSFNIHKGFNTANRRFVLHEMREAIHRHSADLVFLQEVQGEHRRYRSRIREWPDASQFEFLADRTWPHTAYGKNAIYDEGHHGNAILSRFPFLIWENLDISSSRYERRGILHGVLSLKPELTDETKKLHVLCVHLSLFEADRRKQLHVLGRRIRETIPLNEPLILAGDFNDWREVSTKILREEAGLEEAFIKLYGKHARTFPSFLPALRLDRVYFRGLKVISGRTLNESPWADLSDHLGLEVEMEW